MDHLMVVKSFTSCVPSTMGEDGEAVRGVRGVQDVGGVQKRSVSSHASHNNRVQLTNLVLRDNRDPGIHDLSQVASLELGEGVASPQHLFLTIKLPLFIFSLHTPPFKNISSRIHLLTLGEKSLENFFRFIVLRSSFQHFRKRAPGFTRGIRTITTKSFSGQ
jgi:hypothetical protein